VTMILVEFNCESFLLHAAYPTFGQARFLQTVSPTLRRLM